jgi:DnaJ homolog subfamily C member 28
MSAQQQPPRPEHGGASVGKPDPSARMRRWADHVEELLEEARQRGDFDNLEGAGKPLRLEKNVYAGDKALAYSLLKNNQLAPPEIERGKEIDAELARAEAMLASLRRHREALRFRLGPAFVSERRAYNVLRDKTETRYGEAVHAINSKILSLNIVAPSALHRRMIDRDARMRAFAEEFPRLDEA